MRPKGEKETAHSHPHSQGVISRLTCMGPKGEEETAHSLFLTMSLVEEELEDMREDRSSLVEG